MNSLIIVLKSLNHCIGRRIEKISKQYGVSGVQFYVLSYISKMKGEKVYQKDIEKFLNVRRSTATGILQNLTQKGMIERVSSSEDARLKEIVLCEKAQTIISEFDKEIESLKEKAEVGISEEEKELFIKVVEKIKGNLKEGE